GCCLPRHRETGGGRNRLAPEGTDRRQSIEASVSRLGRGYIDAIPNGHGGVGPHNAMKQTAFAPGFRLSVVDVSVIVGGTTAAIVLSMYVWWWGFVPAFVLAHFFLFCNVVRMARPLELVWAGVFVVLAGATVAFETPGWLVTAVVSLLVTV